MVLTHPALFPWAVLSQSLEALTAYAMCYLMKYKSAKYIYRARLKMHMDIL